jgi:hypothetical protein
MTSDRINILHQEFVNFTGSTFNVLYSDQEFTDVTLVCDEDKQVKAHKVILSSSSKLFRRILLRNPHQHPLIYLKGIGYEKLQFILQFMYLGQIEISHDYLELFIETAKELEINGLTDLIYANTDSFENEVTLENTEEPSEDKQEYSNIENKTDMSESMSLKFEPDAYELIDANPVENGSQCYKCDQCTSSFPGKGGLKKHTRTIHEGLSYPLSGAERMKRYKEKRKSLFGEDTLREIKKGENQKKNAHLKVKRMEDKDFDEKFREETRERKRRFREKKALEEAIATRTGKTF